MMFYVLFSLFVATAFSADLDSQAKLLASKTVENKFIVENRELTIKYSIYNVGTSAASQVNLADETFPIQDFEAVRGQLPAAWKSIAPNGNVTHIVVYKPLKAGYFNFTSAQITYVPSEGAELQKAFTSFPGEGGIMTEVDFARKHSPHLLEWTIFILMCLPSLVIPFSLWYKSHSKYTNAQKPKKQ